jgi:hypothetical protein
MYVSTRIAHTCVHIRTHLYIICIPNVRIYIHMYAYIDDTHTLALQRVVSGFGRKHSRLKPWLCRRLGDGMKSARGEA